MNPDKLDQLYKGYGQVAKLKGIQKLLFWDSQVMMAESATSNRGEQMAALEAAINRLLVDPVMSELCSLETQELDCLADLDRINCVELQRLCTHAIGVPQHLLEQRQSSISQLGPLWNSARETGDFSIFARGFEPYIDLQRAIAQAKADHLGCAPYDTLMDEHDPGLRASLVDPLFDSLESRLPEYAQKWRLLVERAPSVTPPGAVPRDVLQEVVYRVLGDIGFPIEAARVDESKHPFTMRLSPGDTRITTNYDENRPLQCVFSALHEAGHALYERNLPSELRYLPAGGGRGAAVHESQAIFLERMLGCSDEFHSYLSAVFREYQPDSNLGDTGYIGDYLRQGNTSLIRVQADEIHYPLHIVLRYRIERELIEGTLQVKDIPDRWGELSHRYFGRVPEDIAAGCLQDIHWASGFFGYFQSYALGLMLAAQLYDKALVEYPDILPSLGRGDFSPAMQWLKENIHQIGSTLSFAQLIQQVTGRELDAESFFRRIDRVYLGGG